MEKIDPKQHLKKFEELAAACNRCGFCTSYCPTYNATGNEVHSPRGRNQLFRALIEGKVTDPSQAKESFDTCLLCGECTSVCFSEVPTARLMVEARNYLNQVTGVPKFLAFFLKTILPHPKRMKWVLKISFLAKKAGIPWVLQKTGLLKRFFPTAAAADDLLTKVPAKFLLEYPATQKYQTAHRAKFAYMPVCGSQYVRPSVGLATFNLFERLKLDFSIPESVCCGLPAASYGVNDRVRELGRENIRRFENGRYEAIVTDDSSCTTHLKDLPTVFQNDSDWLYRSHEVVQKIKELSSFLIQRGLKEHLKMAHWTGGVVAFHDPCKAQYGQRLTSAPRELLEAIPRLKLVPIQDADQCCGGAGTYSFVHPELSQQVLAAKVENIIASGCKIVVTSSASCLIQLSFGLRQKKSDIEALHLTEFLVRAIEKKR